jgi:hypothetical protein
MKAKKYEEEDDTKFFSLKVPMDHKDKDSKTYVVKIKKYDTGTPEDFLRWRLTLNEQMKNPGYTGNDAMIMNLAQAMLAGRGLEAMLSERWSQDVKKRHASPRSKQSIQSGWRYAFEKQSGYMKRDLLMGKLNPE